MHGLWNRLRGDAKAEKGKKENGKEKDEDEKIVTLVGSKLAKVGEEFVFLGAAEKCRQCKLKNSCTNLEVGRRYLVEKVREEIKHDCEVHEDGVRVVEVREPAVKALVEAKRALKGSKIIFEPTALRGSSGKAEEGEREGEAEGEKGGEGEGGGEEGEYELFELCNPLGLKKGERCTILEVLGDAPVPGFKVVKLKREEEE